MSEFLAWKADPSKYFGCEVPGFEKLRKPWPESAPFDLVETSYYGFSIPEENIHCEIYHWAHPKFGVTSGGVMIFRGKKSRAIDADYTNYINFQPLPDDITDCTYTDGLAIKMVGPSEFVFSYNDSEANTSFEFTAKGIMPPAFRPTGGHITQAMRTTGTLTLRGQRYDFDSYFTRDRSWGDPRAERRLDIPPIGWHVGAFGDDLAFHVCSFDSANWNPVISEKYPGLAEGKHHIWGYIWKNGKTLGVKTCEKVTRHGPDGLAPDIVELKIIDEYDAVYSLHGTITCALPINVFQNMSSFHFCLTRWVMDGESRVGWGDTQQAVYQDFLR
jgi:hypothetical protein